MHPVFVSIACMAQLWESCSMKWDFYSSCSSSKEGSLYVIPVACRSGNIIVSTSPNPKHGTRETHDTGNKVVDV